MRDLFTIRDKSKMIARKLRKSTTSAETYLWQYLRRHQLDGYRFLRQYRVHLPYRFFVMDFACPKYRLGVELDGSIHLVESVMERDGQRQSLIEAEGWKILRFTNRNVFDNTEFCLEQIRRELDSLKESSPI